MIELLPCAHCGSEVDFHQHSDGSLCHIIICKGCKGEFDLSETVPEQDKIKEAGQEAIGRIWNQRCPDAAEQARDRILRNIAADLKKRFFPGEL